MNSDKARDAPVHYFIDNGLFLRRWTPKAALSDEWEFVNQIVVPTAYRQHILSVAHESQWSGHLGVTKTYDLVLQYFFWPGLKSDVAKYWRCCHVCKLVGKPNRVIPPVLLHPIPVTGEPFERVLIDCVGPLLWTKGGNQYLLTIMYAFQRQFPCEMSLPVL